MFYKTLLVSSIAAAGALVACGGSDNNSSNGGGSAKTDLKTNYINIASAVYTDSYDTAVDLQTAVNAFVEAPSDANLEAARSAYKASRKPYQQSEMFRWDEESGIVDGYTPREGGIASVDGWEGQVNAWPLEETAIDVIIAGTGDINEELLLENNGLNDNEANVTTGIHAIEFMLWGEDNDNRAGADRAAADFAAIACDDDTEACRNSQYLVAATDLLVKDLEAMKNEWSGDAKTTSGTLAYNFEEAEVGEVIGYLLTASAQMAQGELAGARLTAGFSDGSDLPLYEEEHDCFSDLSHVAVFYNFQGLENTLNGSYTSLDGETVSGTSLSEVLRNGGLVDSQLDEIEELYATASTAMTTVFELGEADTTLFDDIIQQSFDYNDVNGNAGAGEKPAGLAAVDTAADALTEITPLFDDIAGLLVDVDFDADNIGETD
jgi:putative iron-regulated protein